MPAYREEDLATGAVIMMQVDNDMQVAGSKCGKPAGLRGIKALVRGGDNAHAWFHGDAACNSMHLNGNSS